MFLSRFYRSYTLILPQEILSDVGVGGWPHQEIHTCSQTSVSSTILLKQSHGASPGPSGHVPSQSRSHWPQVKVTQFRQTHFESWSGIDQSVRIDDPFKCVNRDFPYNLIRLKGGEKQKLTKHIAEACWHAAIEVPQVHWWANDLTLKAFYSI